MNPIRNMIMNRSGERSSHGSPGERKIDDTQGCATHSCSGCSMYDRHNFEHSFIADTVENQAHKE